MGSVAGMAKSESPGLVHDELTALDGATNDLLATVEELEKRLIIVSMDGPDSKPGDPGPEPPLPVLARRIRDIRQRSNMINTKLRDLIKRLEV